MVRHQPSSSNRIGFHYFPDTIHYQKSDLQKWLPELLSLGSSWLTLVAPLERTIPEYFIRGIREAQIEPVIHFRLRPENPVDPASLSVLLHSYHRWDVRYIVIYDRPNLLSGWSAAAWAQADLVERFLDNFLPLGEQILQAGLIPVFPPLEPGGDYWDLAFLRAALRGIRRRASKRLQQSLVIGAYGWAGNRPLDWGRGGPERWPAARPYFTPAEAQDQIGFRICDWYSAVAQAELGLDAPILYLKAGSRIGDQLDPQIPVVDQEAHTRRNLAIARWLSGDLNLPQEDLSASIDDLEPIPAQVLACNFWLLSAAPESPSADQAWFHPTYGPMPAVAALRNWMAGRKRVQYHPDGKSAQPGIETGLSPHPIEHYLLLPGDTPGSGEVYLETMRSFIEKHRPTVGFSIEEALLAVRVTVAGGIQAFPEETIDILKHAGCAVERVISDGTVVAT